MYRLLAGSLSLSPSPAWLRGPAVHPQEKPDDFYGKPVSLVKVFGQRSRGEAAAGAVTGNNVYHALRARRRSVADAERDLRVRRGQQPRPRLPKHRQQVGRPGVRPAGRGLQCPNGDCNLGMFGKPSAATLCLTSFPVGTNVAEQWMRHHLDVDAAGNLYVADVYNDRVLVYLAPFSADKTGGKGDAVADLVIGQPDFASNGPNRGRGKGSRTRVRCTSASAGSTTSAPAGCRSTPRVTCGSRTRSTSGCCGSRRARPRPTSCSASPTSPPRRPSRT